MTILRHAQPLPTRSAEGAAERPVMLVSSCGGHFTELELIADRRGFSTEERHWVVPSTEQTQDALAGVASVSWVPRVESRQLVHAMGNLAAALALHRRVRPRLVLSTGAAQAVPHLLAAACHRTPVEYVESVARLDGPSVTGRIAAHLPATELIAPVDGWGGRWQCEPDVFSAFEVHPAPQVPVSTAIVALGTEHFEFPRAVAMVCDALPDAAVTWQTGTTSYSVDGEQLNRWLGPGELSRAMGDSSVVIVHGGAGSILTALAAGKVPVVLARSAALGEHVDDHQVRMGEALADRGLVVLVRPGETLTRLHLERASSLVSGYASSLAPARPAGAPVTLAS